MAKIKEMLSEAIIDGFKGSLDYYYHDGVACVRSWPRKPTEIRNANVRSTWEAFSWAAKNWNTLTPYVQDAYKSMAAGTNMSGRDMFTKCYLSPVVIRL